MSSNMIAVATLSDSDVAAVNEFYDLGDFSDAAFHVFELLYGVSPLSVDFSAMANINQPNESQNSSM
jgi:hypothetical protein